MRTPTLAELLARLQQRASQLAPAHLALLPHPRLTLQAVLHDLWSELFGQRPSAAWLRRLEQLYLPAGDPQRERLAGLLLALWLLQAPALRPLLSQHALEGVLLGDFMPLLEAMPAGRLFRDSERQEELARFWLRQLGVQPLDESPADSAERWDLVSSQRRKQLFAELRRRRRREQAVRQAQQRRQQEW